MKMKGLLFVIAVLMMPVAVFAADVKMTKVIKLGVNYEVSGLPDMTEDQIIGMEPFNHLNLYLNYKKDHQFWARTPWGHIEARHHFNKGKHQITINVNAEEGANPHGELYIDGVSIPILKEPSQNIGTPQDIIGKWVNGALVNMKKISICENCTFTADQIKQFNR